MAPEIPLPRLTANPSARAGEVQRAPVASGLSPGQSAGTSSPAFRALLERLEQDARGLDQRAHQVADAGALDGAMRDARASLERALELGQGLVEALHAERIAQGKDQVS